VKLGSSNLVGRFIIACPAANHPWKGRGQGDVPKLWILHALKCLWNC